MVHSQRFTSRERSHSFPHRETAATLLPFLSSPCAWSGVCHVSQMRGSHSQIPMWLPCPDPEPRSSHRKAPSIRHVRRSSPCHCSPLFPFLTFHISRNNTSMRPPGFILPTLTEILFDSPYYCLVITTRSGLSSCRSYLISCWPRADSHIRLP
jgi:hypothetical protein